MTAIDPRFFADVNSMEQLTAKCAAWTATQRVGQLRSNGFEVADDGTRSDILVPADTAILSNVRMADDTSVLLYIMNLALESDFEAQISSAPYHAALPITGGTIPPQFLLDLPVAAPST